MITKYTTRGEHRITYTGCILYYLMRKPLSAVLSTGLDSKHLQSYLDEFCYRFNRRKFEGEWFSRLIALCAKSTTITHSELVG